MMRVLVGCETSGKVREAFRRRGHEAWSCDLLPSDDNSPFHLQCDIRRVLYILRGYFDLFIVHPECTFLSVSGLHWNKRRPERAALTELAVAFAIEMMSADVPRIVMENPIGCLSSRYRKPDQIIQPNQFGADASKATCLWLKNVEPLVIRPELQVLGRRVEWPRGSGRYVQRWANQTDSGQNKLPPSADRWKLRSETYDGVAEAFAENWG